MVNKVQKVIGFYQICVFFADASFNFFYVSIGVIW